MDCVVDDLGSITSTQQLQAPIWLATPPELAATNGQFFDRFRPVPFAKAAQNPELARPVWQWSSDLVDGPLNR